MNDVINLGEKLGKFSDTWSPRTIGELNGQRIKLAKLDGEFVWHNHADEDELFLVLEGELTIQMRDREVHLKAGELFIVPRGVEHNPVTTTGASVMLFEPAQIKHTGQHVTERTVTDEQWI